MIDRKIYPKIKKSLDNFPAVVLLGSRQVGKTTLAKKIASAWKEKAVYLDLELHSDYQKLQEAEIYLEQLRDKLVIIDEVQRMPDLFALLRALIDKKKKPGRFLLLGSASPDLLKESSETLAGRVIYHELFPFSLDEVESGRWSELWLKGGYPESFLAADEEGSLMWRESFIRTYLERDIPQFGINIPAMQMRRFLNILSHMQGKLWNASQIANSLDISAPTVRSYLDILENTFIIRRLLPFHTNIKKRLVKSPKIYIRDAGLLHALINRDSLESLHNHPDLGSSWEGFVIEQVISLLPTGWQYYFFRTAAGAEIDLVLLDKNLNLIAIEIKYSLSPKIPHGFFQASNDLNCGKKFIIYPGKDFYRIKDSIYALPVSQLERLFTDNAIEM